MEHYIVSTKAGWMVIKEGFADVSGDYQEVAQYDHFQDAADHCDKANAELSE